MATEGGGLMQSLLWGLWGLALIECLLLVFSPILLVVLAVLWFTRRR